MDKWDVRFMQVAEQVAGWSKDPRTQVGCVIVDDARNQLSGGFNGFPRLVGDTEERLVDRATKLQMVVHAEANAVAAAARKGTSLLGGTAYVTREPCSQCTALLIQAGIGRLVYKPGQNMSPEWVESFKYSQQMLREALVLVEALGA